MCRVPHQRAGIQNMGRVCAQFAVSYRAAAHTPADMGATSVGCLVSPSPLLHPPALPSFPCHLSLPRFLHVLLHFLSTGSPGDSPPGPALTAALQWFTCLKRRVAQLESAVHCNDGGPPKKRLKTEGCLCLHPPSLLPSPCVCRTDCHALFFRVTGDAVCPSLSPQPPSC